MKLFVSDEPVAVDPIIVPEAETPIEDLDVNSLAGRLRVNRDMLAEHRRDLDQMIVNLCEMHPPFGSTWREVRRLEAEVPKIEEALKAAARKAKRTLEFIAQGFKVLFSNPVRREVDAAALLRLVPDLRRTCPDVLVDRVEVDLKAFDVALAAGVLPLAAADLVQKIATTREGRVQLEDITPPPA